MATQDEYTNIVLKRLLDYDHLGQYLFDYLINELRDAITRVYDKDGTFGSTKVVVSASGNDEFDLSSQEGTDGRGYFLESGKLYDSVNYEQNVAFENTNAVIYDIGLRRALVPIGAHNNPRTGLPEYQRWQERIGKVAQPTSIATGTGSNVYVNLPTSLCDNNRTHAGRKALVWKVDPLSTDEDQAIQLLTVQFTGSINRVLSNDFFGGTAKDPTAANYRVCLLGPRVTRQSETDLEAEADTWYIGEIEGDGAGNPPINPDNTNQRTIEYSLSDVLEEVQANEARSEANERTNQSLSIGMWQESEFPFSTIADTADIQGVDGQPYYLDVETVVNTPGAFCGVGEVDSVSGHALILYTLDGYEILRQDNPKAFDLNDVVWDPSNEKWIAVGDADGTDAYIINVAGRPSGTWAERTNPKNFKLNAVEDNGAGLVIAAGVHDGTDIYAVKSTDGGDTWSEISIPGSAGEFVNDIAYGTPGGSPMWVAVGGDGSNHIVWWSTDGDTWTKGTVNGTYDGVGFRSVVWSGSAFVTAGPDAGSSDGEIARSTDGKTFNYVTEIEQGGWDLCADPIHHVVIVARSSNWYVSYDDGADWTQHMWTPRHFYSGVDYVPKHLGFNGRTWYAFGHSQADDKVWGFRGVLSQ